MRKASIVLAVLLTSACGSDPAPGAPDSEPLAPIQMIDRANDVADQVEERYEQLEP